MSWERLPLELVLQIVSDNCLQSQDLASLARVNRSLNQAATQYLYRDVQLSYRGCRLGSFPLFDRSITECPALIQFIRTARVVGSNRQRGTFDIHRITEVAVKLHCLERLDLSKMKIDFGFILDSGALPKLRQLHLDGDNNITLDDFAKFI